MYSLPNNIEKRLYVKILFSESGSQALSQTAYFRNDMTMDFYHRWEWYFKYRAALLQVKNPKAYVEFVHGSYDFVLPETEYREKLKNLIRAARAKISQFDLSLINARENWNELFPIEQHPDWTKVVQKRERYYLRLDLLTKEYQTII